MSTQLSSEYRIGPNNKPYYEWTLTPKEREHISTLLGIDATSMDLRGSKFNQQRMECAKCGKHSGLDDLIHNALAQGMHSKEFMIDILKHGTKGSGTSSAHAINCSTCGEQFAAPIDWELGDEGW